MSNRIFRPLSADTVVDGLKEVADNPVLSEILRSSLENTSWWKRNRTSVANIVGLILNLLMFIPLVSAGVIQDPQTAAYVALGVQGLTATIGIFVPDAVSKGQVRRLVQPLVPARGGKHRLRD